MASYLDLLLNSDFTTGNPADINTGYTPTLSGSLGTFTDPLATAATNTPLPGGSSSYGLGDNLSDSTGSGLGWNTDTLKLALGGIETIGGLWAAWEQNKLAKEQLELQKDTTNINLANQISAYNTTLEGKTAHRAAFSGLSDAEVNDYLNTHRLQEQSIG